MAYERKTIDVWNIETNYGYGWECEYTATTRAEAKQIYKDYVENACGRWSTRIVKRRERKAQ